MLTREPFTWQYGLTMEPPGRILAKPKQKTKESEMPIEVAVQPSTIQTVTVRVVKPDWRRFIKY
jgi:hypothetical protein